MRTLSTGRLASHLTELDERIAESVRNSGVKKRRSLDKKSGVVLEVATAAIDKAHSELLEESAALPVQRWTRGSRGASRPDVLPRGERREQLSAARR